jgi:hypothetical protein
MSNGIDIYRMKYVEIFIDDDDCENIQYVEYDTKLDKEILRRRATWEEIEFPGFKNFRDFKQK